MKRTVSLPSKLQASEPRRRRRRRGRRERGEEDEREEEHRALLDANTKAKHRRFFRAVDADELDEALWMVDAGEIDHVDLPCSAQETLFTKACGIGNLDVVRACLEHSCNMGHKNMAGRNGLMKAAANGHDSIVRTLLANCDNQTFDLFASDNSGKSALDWARLSRQKTCAHLIQDAIRQDIQEERQLLRTKERIKVLQENVFVPNELRQQALATAIQEYDLDAIQSIVQECNMSKASYEKALEEYRSLRKENPSEEPLHYYIDTDIGGMTALLRASAESRDDLIGILVENGADVNLASLAGGHNPLTWSSACGQFDAVKALLNFGADVLFQTEKEGRTALMYAVLNKHARIAMHLVDATLERSMNDYQRLLKASGVNPLNVDKVSRMRDWSAFFQEYLHVKDNSGLSSIEYARKLDAQEIMLVFEEALARIEDRRSRISVEKEATEPVFCQNGCGFSCGKDQIEKHEQWSCSKRFVQCERVCGDKVPASNMLHHLENECRFRIIRCPNIYLGCSAKKRQVDMDSHLLHKCPFRMIACRLGCGANLHFKDLADHELASCPLRVVQCNKEKFPGGCGAFMKWNLLTSHLQSACPNRLVKCRVSCGRSVRFFERHDHEENECKRPCSLGCGAIIGPLDRRLVHEHHFCDFRVVTCKNNCGIVGLREKDRIEHEASQCPRRPISCPLYCGKTIEHCEIQQHTTGESGDCPHRLLPCLYDYVGKHVHLHMKESPATAFIESFDLSSGKHLVRVGTEKVWINFQTESKDVQPRDFASWSCGLLRARDRERHIAEICPKRKLQCTNGCGQLLPATHLEKHLVEGCISRKIKCSNAGCDVEMVWTEKYQHEHLHCKFQKVKCSCGEWLDKFELENHAQVDCAAAKIRCTLGCAQYVERRHLENHVRNECPKREVGCTLGCGSIMWAEELPNHEEQLCSHRPICCPHCNVQGVCRWFEFDTHVRENCPKRPYTCECGLELPFDELAQHAADECPRRKRWCPQGCKTLVAEEDMEEHESMQCPCRITLCRLQCGDLVRLDLCDAHEANDCRRRPVTCPNGCSEMHRAEAIDVHLHVCLDRVIPCAQGSQACARKLRSWLTGDLFHGSGRVVLCEAHRESVLTYAAANNEMQLMHFIMSQIENLPPPSQNASRRELAALEDPVLADKLKRERAILILSQESSLGHTPVTWAAVRGHLDMLRYFDELGADFNFETSRGRTPLSEAILGGHVNVIRFLIKKKVLVNRKTKLGLTPRKLALKLGNLELAELLREAETFMQDQARLFAYISLSNVEGLDKLLKHGEPYFLNQEKVLEAETHDVEQEIKRLRNDQEELEANHVTIRPALDETKSKYETLQKEWDVLEASLKAVNKERDRIHQQLLGPVMEATTMAINFLRAKDFEDLHQVTQPTKKMELIMQTACIILEVLPEERPDPLDPFKTHEDYWSSARKHLFSDKASVKQRLLRWLRTSNLDVQMLKQLEPLLKELDSLIGLPQRDASHQDQQQEHVSTMLPRYEDFVEKVHHDLTFGDQEQEKKEKDQEEKEMDEEDIYPTLLAFNFWVHAMETKSRLHHLRLQPLDMEEQRLIAEKVRLEKPLEVARQRLNAMEMRVRTITDPLGDIKKELVQVEKEYAVLKNQLYCVKLISTRTLGGHTALSWAAMYGDARVVELLLDRGSSVDYEDEQLFLAAELIQLVVRYFLTKKARPRWSPALALEFQKEDLVFYFQFKSTTKRHRAFRHWSRSPLAHAVYNGHKEAAQVLLKGGACIHRRSYIFPVGPAPYVFPTPWDFVNSKFRLGEPPMHVIESHPENSQAQEEDDRIWNGKDEENVVDTEVLESNKPVPTVLDCAQVGLKYQGCKEWKHGRGWVDDGRHQVTLEYVERIWDVANKRREYLLEANRLKRAVADEAAKVAKLHEKMGVAILHEDFGEVIRLAEQGANIDFETPEGYTPLAYAAWRGTESVNKDGEKVLAVEMLLDGTNKIPNINREIKSMHTPLSLAAKAGRVNVMEALLRRGANLHVVLRDRKTPLIHAAANGKWDACRMLLDRGVDLHHRDIHRKTALDWARESCYVDVIRKLSERRYQNLGRVTAERGDANPLVMCGWGCGAKLRTYPNSFFSKSVTTAQAEMEEDENYVAFHEANLCPKRIVECPYSCGIQQMWAEELQEHMEELCPNRPVVCPLGCKRSDVKAKDQEKHKQEECTKRKVECTRCKELVTCDKMKAHDKSECAMRPQLCANGCGVVVPWSRYAEHRQKQCVERCVRCRLCGKDLIAKERDIHEQVHCPDRMVECKWGCFDGVVYKRKGAHEINECPRRPVDCPNKCHAFVEARNLDKHLQTQCSRRFIACKLHCGMRIPAGDMEKHVEKECMQRKVFCPNAGCKFSQEQTMIAGIVAKELEQHMDSVCAFRPIQCAKGCGEKVPLALLEGHKMNSCSKRLVTCRVGCPKQVPFESLEHHEKEECRKRLVWCSQGCDAVIPAEQRNRHHKRECPKRFVLCSLGCGEEMWEQDRDHHEQNACIRRKR